jgi:hypothetical protein
MNYETAPIEDEALFVVMNTQTISGVAISPPLLTKIILSALPPQPLSRSVRWRLPQSGCLSGWDVPVRLLASANAVGMAG